MVWTKGKSGNPGGRPQLAKAWEAATGKKIGEVTAEALKLVYDRAMLGPKPNHFGDPNDPDWRFASQKMLEYSAGKPKETVEIIADNEGAPRRDPSTLSDDELRTALGAIDTLKRLAVSPDDTTEH
jgi:hypothetical protein